MKCYNNIQLLVANNIHATVISKCMNKSFWYGIIKGFQKLLSITVLRTRSFLFLVCFFHFHCTLFCGLAGACVNPESIFQTLFFVHSILCPKTHSFLDGFQPRLVQHFS